MSLSKPLIVDSHQDLAWNMLAFGRDYTRPVAETRRRERGGLAPQVNDDTLLGWDAYQKGRVAVVFSTLFVPPQRWREGKWEGLYYTDAEDAHRRYRQQAEAYHDLVDEHADKFTLIQTQDDLQGTLDRWARPPDEGQDGHPVGLVVLMEGAEGVREPGELETWWELGVRLIGPAWAGTRFCGGTKEPGPLSEAGYELLEAMADLGFTLDISHMDEKAVLQAFDCYAGRVVATHANPKALLPGTESNRFLSDRVIERLLERDGVIGVVPYNLFLDRDWKRGDPRERVSLQALVEQIDYLCQMAGDALHVGLGSDFDGGFGLQSVPPELDTVADLQKLAAPLSERGYTGEHIAAILGGNWTRLLKEALPSSR